MENKNKKRRAGQIVLILGLILVGATALYPNEVADAFGTFIFDITPPDIEATYPQGSVDRPDPLTLGETITLKLWSRSPDIDITKTTVLISRRSAPSDISTVSLNPNPANQAEFTGLFTIEYEDIYHLNFHLWDRSGNKSTKLVYGEVGDANGDFYAKDGNDFEYINVTKDTTVIFNDLTVYFKFNATNHGEAITRVWIEVVGQTTFDLTEVVTDSEWDGSTWIAPGEGTYTVNGYFTAYGKTVRALSIGINVPPLFPQGAYWTIGIGSAVALIGALVWYRYKSPSPA